MKCPKCGTEFGEDITISLGEERTCPGCGGWTIITDHVCIIPDYEPLEQAFLRKAREILVLKANPTLLLLSGEFFSERGLACSMIRLPIKGTKLSTSVKKGTRLEAMLVLSVFLGNSARFTADYAAMFGEIRTLLAEEQREDLWEILKEKLPFVPIPPAKMLPEGLASPACAYYIIKSDDSLVLGELYPSVRLDQMVKPLSSRYFCFSSWQGYTAFAFFNRLSPAANLGFNSDPAILKGGLPDTESATSFLEEAKTFKDLLVAIIEIHEASLMWQYLVPDYESPLFRVLKTITTPGSG